MSEDHSAESEERSSIVRESKAELLDLGERAHPNGGGPVSNTEPEGLVPEADAPRLAGEEEGPEQGAAKPGTYNVAFVYPCCGGSQAALEPELIVAAVQGATIKVSHSCGQEWILRPSDSTPIISAKQPHPPGHSGMGTSAVRAQMRRSAGGILVPK